MTQKIKTNIKRGAANTFGAFGYLICSLQWFWAVILYFSVIQSTTSFISSSTSNQTQQYPTLSIEMPDSLALILLVIVVVVMAAITIYALVSVPRSIVRTSNKAVHKAAEAITPVILKSQHQHDTKKTRMIITTRLIIIIKVLLIVAPIALAAASRLLDEQPIDHTIVMIISGGLAALSTIFFATQYLIAALFRIKFSKLW